MADKTANHTLFFFSNSCGSSCGFIPGRIRLFINNPAGLYPERIWTIKIRKQMITPLM